MDAVAAAPGGFSASFLTRLAPSGFGFRRALGAHDERRLHRPPFVLHSQLLPQRHDRAGRGGPRTEPAATGPVAGCGRVRTAPRGARGSTHPHRSPADRQARPAQEQKALRPAGAPHVRHIRLQRAMPAGGPGSRRLGPGLRRLRAKRARQVRPPAPAQVAPRIRPQAATARPARRRQRISASSSAAGISGVRRVPWPQRTRTVYPAARGRESNEIAAERVTRASAIYSAYGAGWRRENGFLSTGRQV